MSKLRSRLRLIGFDLLLFVQNKGLQLFGKAKVFCSQKGKNISVILQKNPLLYLFARTWQYSVNNRVKVGIFWLMFAINELMDLCLMPYLWSRIINIPQVYGLTKSSMVTLCVLLGLTLLWTVLYWCIHGPARVMECGNAFQVRANYRLFLLNGIMNLPMDWHVEHHSGETIDRIEKGVNALYSFSEDSFEVVYSMARLVGTYVMLTMQFRPAGIIVLVMMIVTAMVIIHFDKVLVPQYQSLNKAENRISESTFDGLSNIVTVIILRVEALIYKAIAHKVEEPRELFRDTSVRNEWKWFLVSLCCRITIILVLGTFLFYHFWNKEVVLGGTVYLIISYSQKMTDLFNRFAGMYGDIVRRRTRVSNAELLSQDFSETSFSNHVLPVDWRVLEVSDLSFSYGGNRKGELHLEGVSIRFEKGKTYGLIGKSGSGKTTLLKVMRDLYPYKSGTVKVDNVILEDGFASIARGISLIPQNAEIFATTVWENITLGAEYGFDLIEDYAGVACFSQVVKDLPHGYDSRTKEKGVNLSGGQQQRLALTRGLVASHDKELVLLDEPTSSLDVETELLVFENIMKKFAGKTIVASVHRLHLLPLFDEIIMFEKGRVIASGALQNLLLHNEKFSLFWSKHIKR